MLQEINDTNFNQLVILSKSNKPILVDFWAPWCAPCKSLSILLEEIYTNEYKKKALFFKLNVDDNPKYSDRYKIRSIPTMIFFKDGKKKDMHIGVATKEDIREKLNKLI
ncbi:thioredoxin [Blattabacterium cuenoti]|uniref:thioredoxin n=1 Tax=Blattabacterium cuenoti TaxID=1653831 RepID=UPI00163D2FF7|nr:thioredoxin [Blattabacterium cuenoti]